MTSLLSKSRGDSLSRYGSTVEVVALDLQHEESIHAAVETSTANGPIDILLNNAGCNIRKPALDVQWEDWNTILDTNLRGMFFHDATCCSINGGTATWPRD